MRIAVNESACEGHGLCAQAAPEVYEVDDEGVVQLLTSEPTGALLDAAEAGARVCPVAAITVHE